MEFWSFFMCQNLMFGSWMTGGNPNKFEDTKSEGPMTFLLHGTLKTKYFTDHHESISGCTDQKR